MPSSQSTPTPTPVSVTRSVGRAAFVHITDNILANKNITKALKEDIDVLTHMDPNNADPNNPVAYSLRKGEKGLIKSFIHYVHYCDEIKDPIGDKWLSITQDEFDQFCCNVNYTRQFSTLSILLPTVTTPTSSIVSVTAPPTSSPSVLTLSGYVQKRDQVRPFCISNIKG
jgi:hypothetical protein